MLGYLFLVITVATIVLVILRYFFSTTIVGGQEFIVFCFIYTTAIGAAVLLAKGEHISIQLFLERPLAPVPALAAPDESPPGGPDSTACSSP